MNWRRWSHSVTGSYTREHLPSPQQLHDALSAHLVVAPLKALGWVLHREEPVLQSRVLYYSIFSPHM